MTTPQKKLEFWYEFASTYSYLSVMRIDALAQSKGIHVIYQPFLLGPIFKEQGWSDSPFNLYPTKGKYMWRDMERRCEKYGLPFKRPSTFPRNGLHAARLALLGSREGWAPEFSRRVYTAEFVQDQDIADPAVLRNILREMGRDAEATLLASQSETNKSALKAQTETAKSLGIFGAPSFITNGELYWGDDRLEDALASV